MTGPGRLKPYWPPEGPPPPRRRLGTVLAIVIGLVVVLAVGVTVYVVKPGTSSPAARVKPPPAAQAETTRSASSDLEGSHHPSPVVDGLPHDRPDDGEVHAAGESG